MTDIQFRDSIMFEENKLSREDQAKVDEYLQTGFNGIER